MVFFNEIVVHSELYVDTFPDMSNIYSSLFNCILI